MLFRLSTLVSKLFSGARAVCACVCALAGTGFTLQLQLASTPTPTVWAAQPALNSSGTLSSGAGNDFVGRVYGVPIYSTDYLFAPNGQPCANPKQKPSQSVFGVCVNPSSTVQASVLAVVAAMVAVLALAF